PSDPFRPSPREAVPPQGEVRPFKSNAATVDNTVVVDAPSQAGLLFDFAPASIALAPGQQRSILVRATGENGAANSALTVRFDPAFVTVVSVRSILPDGGVADSHVESGRVVLAIPNAVSISGTKALAEIVLQGVKPGSSTLSFERGASSASFADASVEVR
ncbi:MAG TPA: cohesin domain-containing protein, partial [Thermoanaerobaculia bacterium]|nr:cohesin domain-containing protein [Thermoanaerobaculia bacterium]